MTSLIQQIKYAIVVVLVLVIHFTNIEAQSFTEQTGISLTGVRFCSSSWGDYDNDGDLDLLITGSDNAYYYKTISKIYRNNGNNTFTEQTGISLTGVQHGAVAWGDYDNDGYLDILLTGENDLLGYVSKIYHNNGNNTFTEQTGISLTPVGYSAVAWGDYDNDGDLDILLTGDALNIGHVSKIYRNNGNGTFTEQTKAALPGIDSGAVAWIDYDNDGDLDILLSGSPNSGWSFTKIYRNDGNCTFIEQTSISLKGFDTGSLSCGDYDNDGDMDILITGESTTLDQESKVYRNNGNNTFTELQNIYLKGVSKSSVAWGDYDNDGDLDILLSGQNDYPGYSTIFTKIYQNSGDDKFNEQTNISLTQVYDSSVAWGDYDNDGDLDILITGFSGVATAKIFRNDATSHNVAPDAPSGLTTLLGTTIALQWNSVTTDATPSKGLTYNVRVGSTPGASNIVSPMASASGGFKRLVSIGNAQQKTTYTLRNLKKGTYYWSVQAIDNGYAGGTFTPEQSFVFSTDIQAAGLSLTPVTSTSARLTWTRGNGDNCIVLVRKSSLSNDAPVNNTTYAGNKAFGSGSQIGSSGWYCAYNGNKDTATITGLTAGEEYFFKVIEYTGVAGSEVYYTTIGELNPISNRPAAPNFTINYSTEKTNEIVDATIEYATNISMSGAVAGSSAKLTVTPGTTIYLRKKATALSLPGAIQTIVVQARPAVPVYTIDFVSEKTNENVANTDEYATSSSMTVATTGNNAKITITPGQSIYIRKAATLASFASLVQTLTVPARPTAPIYTIDYIGETTKESVASTDEYAVNNSMTGAIVGSNTKVSVSPGQNIYFRKAATISTFASLIQTLTASARPTTPAYTIDYVAETTKENVSSTDEYATNTSMTGATIGTNTKIVLTPGQNLYFRKTATVSSFASSIQTLSVSARPTAPSAPVENDRDNTFDWTNNSVYTSVSEYEYMLGNDPVWHVVTVKPISVGNIELPVGAVKVRLKATSDRFISTTLVSSKAFTIATAINSIIGTDIKVFPNPAEDKLYIEKIEDQCTVSIYTLSGLLIKQLKFEKISPIPISDLQSGTYLLSIKTQKTSMVTKFIKK